MTILSRLTVALLVTGLPVLANATGSSAQGVVDLYSERLAFESSGYPTPQTVNQALEKMALHGTTQAYLWGSTVLVNDAWRQANLSVAGPLDFVTYTTVEEKYNIITSNLTTPYLIAFPNLGESGPLILEIPSGPTAGILNDFESRLIADTGVAGPDGGKGGKYLILHESWDEPENHGADFIIRSKTYLFWTGSRILSSDPDEIRRLQRGMKLYPLGGQSQTGLVPIGTTSYRGWHPDGMAFWKALHAVIQTEQFPAETRYMLQFLERVGIEKGQPFAPSEQQQNVLIEAERLGKTMAMSLSYSREPYYDEGSQWSVHLGGLSNTNHVNPDNGMKELDGLVAYTWEAFSMSKAMFNPLVGVGSKYLAAYKDSEGNWLNGSNTYQLTVPAHVPAEQFWSLIAYSQATRTFIKNRDRKPGIRSLDNPEPNADGSYTLTIGPERPENVPQKNFIYSIPGEGWFTYFRLYGPTEAYFDKSWRLNEIRRVP